MVVTRHGKEMAALIPLEDLDLLERLRDEASPSRRKLAGWRPGPGGG